MTELQFTDDGSLTEDDFRQNVQDRKAQSCDSFQIDNYGFTAAISLAKENLVFFSVPYEQGWSATVNGQQAEIFKANGGFMAVRCPAGASEIRFDYRTYGLLTGAEISAAGVAVLLLYLLISWLVLRRRPKFQPPVPPVTSELPEPLEMDEELTQLSEFFSQPLPEKTIPTENRLFPNRRN